MKTADVACQCGCGRLVVQPRGGGPRKRFFENACRARWTRRGKQSRSAKRPVAPPAVDDRQATLERLYELLRADVETEGTLIPSGLGAAMKGNPSAALLVRVIAELDRRRAQVEEEESSDVATLHAV